VLATVRLLYKVAASVGLCVCVLDFGKTCGLISMKLCTVLRGHYVDVDGKTSGKFWPLMWTNGENGPLWESPHGPRTLDCAMAMCARLHASHEPITLWPGAWAAWSVAFDAGPSQTLPRRQTRRGANAEGARTEAPRGVRPTGFCKR